MARAGAARAIGNVGQPLCGLGIFFQNTYSEVYGTSALEPPVVALQVDAAGARPPVVNSRWTKVVSASRPPPPGAGVVVADSSSQGMAFGETGTALTSEPTTLLPSLACHV